jgi:MFS family permease
MPDQRTIALQTAMASAIGSAVGLMPALRSIFALFMVPVTTAFGWSRMEYMGSASIAPLCVALLSAPIGWLIDRKGPRFVLVPGFALFGIAMMALSLNNGSVRIAGVLWAMFGLTAATQTPSAYVKALSGWFSARRGLALGLALGGGGALGVAVLPLAVGYVIGTYGWRSAYLVQGLLALVVGSGTMLVWFRDPPQMRATQGGAALAGVSAWDVLRTGTFWLIMLATLSHQLPVSGVFGHVGAMLNDHHVKLDHAAMFLSVYGVLYMLAQFIAGWAMDRVATPKLGLVFFGASFVGVAMLHYLVLGGHTGTVALAATAGVLGIGSGAELTLEAYYITRYFGLRATGQVFGWIYMVVVLSAALGGIAFSFEYDARQSYDLTLKISEVALLVGIGLIALLKPYVYPAR